MLSFTKLGTYTMLKEECMKSCISRMYKGQGELGSVMSKTTIKLTPKNIM